MLWDFVASAKFKGIRRGMAFGTGSRGTGYYRDFGPYVFSIAGAIETRQDRFPQRVELKVVDLIVQEVGVILGMASDLNHMREAFGRIKRKGRDVAEQDVCDVGVALKDGTKGSRSNKPPAGTVAV